MTCRWLTSGALFLASLVAIADTSQDELLQCQRDMEAAHRDNRENGPDWVLIADKVINSADPRQVEELRSNAESELASMERLRVVQIDANKLREMLNAVSREDMVQDGFSKAPHLVLAPFPDRIYGLTVSDSFETVFPGRRVQFFSGVLTNAYGVRGQWRINIGEPPLSINGEFDTTESRIEIAQSASGLIVLGEIGRCRLR